MALAEERDVLLSSDFLLCLPNGLVFLFLLDIEERLEFFE